MGAAFVAVGLDTNLLVKATSALAARFKDGARAAAAAAAQAVMNCEEPCHERRAQARAAGMHPDEWRARVQLAACYRIFDMLGWTEMIYNHITVRLPDSVTGGEKQFLINPFGLHYSEVTASNLLKIDLQGNKLERQPLAGQPGRLHGARGHPRRHVPTRTA